MQGQLLKPLRGSFIRALAGAARRLPAARGRRAFERAALALALIWGTITAGADAGGDWPLYGYDHGNRRFSPLEQIDRSNVHRLKRAWSVKTGNRGSFQATPIVTDGVMIVTLPYNDVLALDPVTGVEIWRYEHDLPEREYCCGPANRGAAVAHGKVYFVTMDARFIALDLVDGSVVWNHPIADTAAGNRETVDALEGEAGFAGARVVGGTGYGANMAPQVFGDQVFVGITGAGYGLHLELDEAPSADDAGSEGDAAQRRADVAEGPTAPGSRAGAAVSVVGLAGGGHGLRGFLVAYDAHTGAERWRWYTVQGPEWTGEWRATTPDGAAMERDIDKERHALAKYSESWRYGGGSVWTTPAVDPALGLIYVGTGNPAPQMDDTTRPGDNRDTVSIVALDMQTGAERWAYQQVPHDRWGYDVASPALLYEIDRDGEQVPVLAQAGKTGWVYVLDRRTGEPVFKSEPFVPQENLFRRPTEAGVRISPGIYGGASWSPMALHPGLERLFVMGIHHPVTYFQKALTPTEDAPWESYTYTEPDPKERWGTLTAIDAASGRRAWQVRTELPLVGGVLATAGHLVFFGEGEGVLRAVDARSGRTLWSAQTDAGVNAPPITYAVNGVQYLTVAAGGNGLFGFPTGDEIVTWRLPDDAGR